MLGLQFTGGDMCNVQPCTLYHCMIDISTTTADTAATAAAATAAVATTYRRRHMVHSW